MFMIDHVIFKAVQCCVLFDLSLSEKHGWTSIVTMTPVTHSVSTKSTMDDTCTLSTVTWLTGIIVTHSFVFKE